MPQAAQKSGGRGDKSGGGAGGKGGCNNDADEAMADAAAELDQLECTCTRCYWQACPASLPDGLLQRILEKKTAKKDKETAEKEKAIKEKEQLQKQQEAANTALELAKVNVKPQGSSSWISSRGGLV
jgi:hypothetical protein